MSVGIAIHNEIIRVGLEKVLRSLDSVSDVLVMEGNDDSGRRLYEAWPEALFVVVDEAEIDWVNEVLRNSRTRDTIVLGLVGHLVDELPASPEGKFDALVASSSADSSTLDAALTAARSGMALLPRTLMQRVLAHIDRCSLDVAFSAPAQLTPREYQALCLLTQGMSNKQIASRLNISVHGAKRLVGNILARLNVPNRTMAAAAALKSVTYADGENVTTGRSAPARAHNHAGRCADSQR